MHLPQSRFSRRILFAILAILTLFALLLVLFQLSREKKFRIELLNTQLQDYNRQLNESLTSSGSLTQTWLDDFLAAHPVENLRLTVVLKSGAVVYDNLYTDVASLPSHRERKEIRTAISRGSGYDIYRMSETLGNDYFYSATYYPHGGYVIRTALPYNIRLQDQLRADYLFFWFALALLVLLVFTVWRFCCHLDQHIICLRTFAEKAENGEPLDTPDLMSFRDDELGEVAERIIVMYRRLKETRQEQDKLKRELTQNIAHELKTPVASIQGYLDTILSQPGMDEQTKRHFLEQGFKQATRLTSLIRDILILNKLDDASARSVDAIEVVDIKQVVTQVMTDTEQGLRRQEMKWETSIPYEKVPVMGTEKNVYSIFRNLTDNAIAYAGRETTITLKIKRDETHWHILFADNGVGVPAEDLPRLFERFYRVDKGRSRDAGGTGLGLSIVKNTVLSMHGYIALEKGLERGLIFRITLPVKEEDEKDKEG